MSPDVRDLHLGGGDEDLEAAEALDVHLVLGANHEILADVGEGGGVAALGHVDKQRSAVHVAHHAGLAHAPGAGAERRLLVAHPAARR